MQTVLMTGKSHHGKNRIAEARRRLGKHWDGITWRVKVVKDRIIAKSNEGPWALVEPVTDMSTDWISRWVNLRDDEDFTIALNTGIHRAASPSNQHRL